MLAIHNYNVIIFNSTTVANAYAKLSKCQQFTTNSSSFITSAMLQTLMQSYQNVSNSQLCYILHSETKSCKRLCKVIKMLAIHNSIALTFFYTYVANAYAKLSKCQQFTTFFDSNIFLIELQTLMQSYQNVSNSQLHYL